MTLLLASPGMIEILIIGAFSLVFYFFLMRWVFRINIIADNLKLQTHLLIKIAQYNNVPIEEINRLTRPDNEKFASAVGEIERIEEPTIKEQIKP